MRKTERERERVVSFAGGKVRESQCTEKHSGLHSVATDCGDGVAVPRGYKGWNPWLGGCRSKGGGKRRICKLDSLPSEGVAAAGRPGISVGSRGGGTRPGVAAGHQSLENGFVDATNPQDQGKMDSLTWRSCDPGEMSSKTIDAIGPGVSVINGYVCICQFPIFNGRNHRARTRRRTANILRAITI